MEDTENTVLDVISFSCMIESRLRISLLRTPCACLCGDSSFLISLNHPNI